VSLFGLPQTRREILVRAMSMASSSAGEGFRASHLRKVAFNSPAQDMLFQGVPYSMSLSPAVSLAASFRMETRGCSVGGWLLRTS
jgi:hypothetical protein